MSDCPCGGEPLRDVDTDDVMLLGIICANRCSYPWRIGSPASAALDVAEHEETIVEGAIV